MDTNDDGEMGELHTLAEKLLDLAKAGQPVQPPSWPEPAA